MKVDEKHHRKNIYTQYGYSHLIDNVSFPAVAKTTD